MGKYVMIWEADDSKIPVDPQERKAGWQMAMEMTKQDIKDGKMKDWGVFAGQIRGFGIFEGTAEEVHAVSLKYIPFFSFQIYPMLSFDQAEKIVEAM